jgi:protease-4
VLAPRFNLSKLMEKYGVEDATVVATGSTYKNAGSMFTPETPEERAYWQGLIDQMYARFKTVVQQGRGSNLKGNMDDIASGKAFTADEAIGFGLIDKIGYSEDAYTYAATTAGLKNPRIVRYERKIGLMDLLSVKSNVGPMGANGAGVTVDAALLDELTKPRLMYLWSTR